MGKNNSGRRKIYIWIFCLTLSVCILSVFAIYVGIKISSGTFIIDFKGDSNQLTLFLALAGLLFAFSAISIYSIFNSNVDRERKEIKKLIVKAKKTQATLSEILEEERKKILHLNNELDELHKKLKIESSINVESLQYALIDKYIYIITSPYTLVPHKLSSIEDLINKEENIISENSKYILLNFYKTKGRQTKQDPIFISKLESLLKKWGMINK